MRISAYITGDECTSVRSVSVVMGGTASLFCHIKHDKNDPNKTTRYQKIWSKVNADGSTKTVYWYTIVDGDTVKYDLPAPGTDYVGRTVRQTVKS